MSDMVNGLYPKERRANAPDFVKGAFSLNISQFREWMQGWIAENPGEEWINLDFKVSKGGKGYAQVDTWKPNKTAEQPKAEVFEDSDIPFSQEAA